MGKKGHSWFSAIKKVFTPNSKDKQPRTTTSTTTTTNNHDGHKVSSKEKKVGGIGRLKRGLFREPSSIEKILGEIDQQKLFIPPLQQPQAQPPPSSSYSERPVSPPPQKSQAQPSSTSAKPVSPPKQPQAQPSSSVRPVSPEKSQAQTSSSSSSARPVSPKQPQAQPSSSYSERPLSPPQESQAQVSSSSARPVSPPAPRVISPPKSEKVTPPVASYVSRPPKLVRPQTQVSRRPKPTLQQQQLSAIRIQAAYRGHMARRNIKGLTGLVRLQGVVRGQNVKRQTVNAMKQMQLLVRVQTQIQSRRIQTLENQALKRQADNNNNDKRSETSLSSKRTEMGAEYWDFSSITKEERDARSRKKVEAIIRRERTLAYAQVRKGTPTSAQNSLMDIRTGGYPWWWNWLDRQLPNSNAPQPLKNLLAATTTPSRSATPDDKRRTHKQLDSPSTPMSSNSMAAAPSRSRTPPNRMMKYSRASRGSGSPFSRDDDSLMSCPQFSSVPNYMSPTVSAKAKARPTTSSNPKDRVSPSPSTPGSETSKRRFSFPFTPNSNKWKKSPASVGGMSVDSSVSVSSSVGRKPFNRFV